MRPPAARSSPSIYFEPIDLENGPGYSLGDIIIVARLPNLSVCLFDRATFVPSYGYDNTRNGYFRLGDQPGIDRESLGNGKIIITITAELTGRARNVRRSAAPSRTFSVSITSLTWRPSPGILVSVKEGRPVVLACAFDQTLVAMKYGEMQYGIQTISR